MKELNEVIKCVEFNEVFQKSEQLQIFKANFERNPDSNCLKWFTCYKDYYNNNYYFYIGINAENEHLFVYYSKDSYYTDQKIVTLNLDKVLFYNNLYLFNFGTSTTALQETETYNKEIIKKIMTTYYLPAVFNVNDWTIGDCNRSWLASTGGTAISAPNSVNITDLNCDKINGIKFEDLVEDIKVLKESLRELERQVNSGTTK